MKNRTTTDMAAAVLESARRPIKKTQLMFRTNIYIRQLNAVLKRLQDKGLIQFDDKTRTFLTTERGREFLELYKSMTDDVHFISQPMNE
jgi:predicted transcriptional regulator